ncbi:hypothetical protein [Streptomyces sp. NPDC058678]|uniref:hypothetical protein n=1 Tax=Streptomyces sp. NPDC058678 TaxID=3346595 RepID=UPI003658E97E
MVIFLAHLVLGGQVFTVSSAGGRPRSNALLIAVDRAAFGGAEGFTEGVEATLSTLKGLPVADGTDGGYYPGERSAVVVLEHAETPFA